MAVQPGVELTEDGPTVGGRVRLTHKSGATCELTRFGAHIVSWKAAVPGGGLAPVERLWMSSLSALDGSAPIRGGIPIAWPQFADLGSLPLHGFARELRWALVSEPGPACSGADIVRAELELSADERTKNGTWREPAAPPFPWEFKLRYAVELAENSLRLQLTVLNTATTPLGPGPLRFTGCLHTYFRTADYEQVRLEGGLAGAWFEDKVDGRKRKQQAAEPLALVPAAAESGGYVDRVYAHASALSRAMRLDVGAGLDAAAPALRSAYEVEMSGSWPDLVVFNPGLDGKRGAKGPDFDDDGYKAMVCVEPAVAAAPVELEAPGEWVGSCRIRILP